MPLGLFDANVVVLEPWSAARHGSRDLWTLYIVMRSLPIVLLSSRLFAPRSYPEILQVGLWLGALGASLNLARTGSFADANGGRAGPNVGTTQRPCDQFPGDDGIFGFDTIAEVESPTSLLPGTYEQATAVIDELVALPATDAGRTSIFTCHIASHVSRKL